MMMNVNKLVCIFLVVIFTSCKENISDYNTGIYFNEETHSLIGMSNDTLVYIKDSLSGICQKYISNKKEFIGEVYGDSLKVSVKGSNLFVSFNNDSDLEYSFQSVPQWDSIRLTNLRRKINFIKYNEGNIDEPYSDADIGAFLLLKGFQLTPLQTTDQSPIMMQLFVDGKTYSSKGAINWICLDIF